MYVTLYIRAKVRNLAGRLMTLLGKFYNRQVRLLTTGADKEVARLHAVAEKKIDTAKNNVILAANRVLELEQQVGVVTTKAQDEAFKKITKVQRL